MQKVLSYRTIRTEPSASTDTRDRAPSDQPTSTRFGWKTFELEHHRLPRAGELIETAPGYRVCLILNGPVSVTWKTGGRSDCHRLGQHDLSMASYGDFRTLSWDAPFELMHLDISPKVMAELSEERGDAKPVELISHRGIRDSNIAHIMQMLRKESEASHCYGSIFGEQLCFALAGYLFERYCVAQPKKTASASRLPGRVLNSVLGHVEERISESITLEDLANHVKMSRFYFARLFRNSLGQSPGQYILDRRMDRAKSLLTSAHVNVKDVARLCGFPSQSHFATAFRLRNGVTPTQYRGMAR